MCFTVLFNINDVRIVDCHMFVDYRPVVAIIEIEIEQVDSVKRQLVSDEVSLMMGPSDPTIVIQGQNDKLDEDESLDPVVLMAMFQSFGEVLMMRLLESKILITFKDARSAVASLELDGKEVKMCILLIWWSNVLRNALLQYNNRMYCEMHPSIQ